MMYALVEYKGKQYKAEKGAQIQVDKIDAEKGSKIDIDTVLMVSDGDKATVGTPYVKGAKVQIVVGETFKDKKVVSTSTRARRTITGPSVTASGTHGHCREYRRSIRCDSDRACS